MKRLKFNSFVFHDKRVLTASFLCTPGTPMYLLIVLCRGCDRPTSLTYEGSGKCGVTHDDYRAGTRKEKRCTTEEYRKCG